MRQATGSSPATCEFRQNSVYRQYSLEQNLSALERLNLNEGEKAKIASRTRKGYSVYRVTIASCVSRPSERASARLLFRYGQSLKSKAQSLL